jgi:WXXGXW repeat (2 copies)
VNRTTTNEGVINMDLRRRAFRALGIPFIAVALVAPVFAQDVNVGVGLGTGNTAANFQVLTTGPVHESFARPVVYGGTNVAYVRSTPPALIDEIPPLTRPAETAEWIPGYWSYDEPANNWIWVSGTWRVSPPGYVWVPGYWYQTSRGWRYVNGYWAVASSDAEEITYLPAPPDPLDLSPVGTAPAADAIWVAGTWVWEGTAYAWQPGYWLAPRNDWVWTPAMYSWTPYGYVFTDGHYDWDPASRGLLYAPVSFVPGSYLTSGFSYAPAHVINVALFTDSLFVRPNYSHYYFGDYYASTWWNWGYYPAFSFHLSRYGYDPLFAWAYWRQGRNEGRWLEERRARFMSLRDNPEARPPRTMDQQARRPVAVPGAAEGETARVAIPVQEVATANVTPLKIETVPETSREQVVARAKEKIEARAERIKLETQAEEAANGGEPNRPRKVRAPKQMLAGADTAAKPKAAPPERPAIPKADAAAKRPEAAKLPEPSLERPAAVEADRAMKREGGRPDAPGKPDDPAKPDAGRPERPEPPRRPEGVPPAPKPDADKPEPPAPPRRPEGVPPQPTPPGRPEGVPPQPKPDVTPPARRPAVPPPQPKPDATPPRRPEGVPPQPLPPPRPEGTRPQPGPPQPKPEGGKPQPAPAPRGNPPAPPNNNPPTPPKKDGGGKPDEKPHGNPRPGGRESRPADGPGS